MGLPIWTVPSPEPKNTVKNDVTASARSPIRRRFPRSPTTGRNVVSSSRSQSDRQRSLGQIDARYGHSLGDAELVSRRPSRRVRTTPPVPPAPENPEVTALRSRPAVLIEGSGRAYADPSRPLSFGEIGDISRHSTTPNFAPAWNGPARLRRQDSVRWESDRDSARFSQDRRHRNRPSRSHSRGPQSRSASLDSTEAVRDLPPLRRMGRHRIEDNRSLSPLVRGTADGLGDRARSISEEADTVWDTMLTTITPDPHMPSVDSSFTSAVASASFSAPDQTRARRPGRDTTSSSTSSIPSARSSSTQLTVPSQEDLSMFNCFESSDGSGSDTEADEDDAGNSFRRSRHREEFHAYNARRRAAGVPPMRREQWEQRHTMPRVRDADMESQYQLLQLQNMARMEVARRETDAVHSFFSRSGAPFSDHSQSDGPHGRDHERALRERPLEERFAMIRERPSERMFERLIGASSIESDEDRELEAFRPILERFAARQDIPESFWTGAGLMRVVSQRGDETR